MAKRFKLKKSRSRRMFTKHAVHANRRNFAAPPMRGGIRL